jgi:hypothetical protein
MYPQNSHIENRQQAHMEGDGASEELSRMRQVDAATENIISSTDVIIAAAHRAGTVSGNVVTVDFAAERQSRNNLNGYAAPEASFWQQGVAGEELDAAA